MTGRRPPRSDAGFTLIELLLVIAILGVIVVPLSDVIIGVLRNTDATSDRMMLSRDAQSAAAFFAQDVAAAGVRDYSGQSQGGQVPYKQSVETNVPYNNNGNTCGTTATPTALLRFLSDDWDTSGATPVQRTDIVAYYLSGTDLHRLKCVGTATTGADVIVSHDVVAGSPTVTCSSTCTSTTPPAKVTLTFQVSARSVGAYSITLSGQRRQT